MPISVIYFSASDAHTNLNMQLLRLSIGFGSGLHKANQWRWCLLKLLMLLPREARSHCIVSKQSGRAVKVYVILQGYASSDNHWPAKPFMLDVACSITFATASPDSYLPHMLSVNLLSSVKRMEPHWWTFWFCWSLVNAIRSACCWYVNTGPTDGCQPLMPPSWSLFLTVWSKTCTWGFVGHLPFFLSQRSRYWSYCCGISLWYLHHTLEIVLRDANFVAMARVDLPSWRSWTICATWLRWW